MDRTSAAHCMDLYGVLSCVESDKATRLFAWRRPVVASAMPKLPQGKNFGAGDAIPEVRCNDMQENVQICSDNQSEVRTGSWNWFNAYNRPLSRQLNAASRLWLVSIAQNYQPFEWVFRKVCNVAGTGTCIACIAWVPRIALQSFAIYRCLQRLQVNIARFTRDLSHVPCQWGLAMTCHDLPMLNMKSYKITVRTTVCIMCICQVPGWKGRIGVRTSDVQCAVCR